MESKRKMEIRLMGFGDEHVYMLLKQVVQTQWTWLGWDGVRRGEVPQISEGEGKRHQWRMYQVSGINVIFFVCFFAYLTIHVSAFIEDLFCVRHWVQRWEYKKTKTHVHIPAIIELCWELGSWKTLTGQTSCPFSPGLLGC